MAMPPTQRSPERGDRPTIQAELGWDAFLAARRRFLETLERNRQVRELEATLALPSADRGRRTNA